VFRVELETQIVNTCVEISDFRQRYCASKSTLFTKSPACAFGALGLLVTHVYGRTLEMTQV